MYYLFVFGHFAQDFQNESRQTVRFPFDRVEGIGIDADNPAYIVEERLTVKPVIVIVDLVIDHLRLIVKFIVDIADYFFHDIFQGDQTGTTTVETPEAINLDFQTGIAEDTLLFANIRYAMYEQTIVSPDFFGGVTTDPTTGEPGSLTDIDNGTSFSVGIGRRLTEDFSASISVGYEAAGDDDLVSPLSPTTGNVSLALGGPYTMGDVVLSGGARYTWLGDAQPETGTPDTAFASFEDNTALAVGFSVGYRF